MKLIAGFDAAIQNLGVFYIEFDDQWKIKLNSYLYEISQLYNGLLDITNKEFLDKIQILLVNLNTFIDNIIKIKFFNVFNLIPGCKSSSVPMLERTRRLKHLLKHIDQLLPQPDIVLIEYQMKHNDISRTISNQIAMWYMTDSDNIPIIPKCVTKSRKSSSHIPTTVTNDHLTYSVDLYPLTSCQIPFTPSNRIIELVGPTLKNTISLYPGGDYANFIVKWSNYVANKKHTSSNFVKFSDVFLPDLDLTNINNKLDDIADGFMMIFAWLKKHNMF
jgi:hypothetical protein